MREHNFNVRMTAADLTRLEIVAADRALKRSEAIRALITEAADRVMQSTPKSVPGEQQDGSDGA